MIIDSNISIGKWRIFPEAKKPFPQHNVGTLEFNSFIFFLDNILAYPNCARGLDTVRLKSIIRVGDIVTDIRGLAAVYAIRSPDN